MDTSQARNTVISVRVDDETLHTIDLLVQAGLAQSRSEAVAQLVTIGINSASELLTQAKQLAEHLQRLKGEMFAAVKAKDIDGVKALLDHDPNLLRIWSEGGDTPVLLSAYYGAQEVTRLLLERGVALNLFEAAAVGEIERVQQLLDADPALINTYSHDGWTPLHLASFFGHKEVALVLLQREADVAALSKNATGNLPLHAALAGRRFEIAHLLVEHGSDINTLDSYHWTPLHHAAYSGNMATVELLLAKGAKLDVRDNKGQIPFDIARERNHHDVAARLR
ncbi:MAG TPA: ankyrin repeat domain-containing protein [Ktedonobacteraceae bacterium]|nr:ankyrin repeat domain-containing protein [Ktedonobacteraceae bacterium]